MPSLQTLSLGAWVGSVVEAIDGTLVETSQDAQEAAIVNDSDGGSEDDQARAIPTTVTW